MLIENSAILGGVHFFKNNAFIQRIETIRLICKSKGKQIISHKDPDTFAYLATVVPENFYYDYRQQHNNIIVISVGQIYNALALSRNIGYDATSSDLNAFLKAAYLQYEDDLFSHLDGAYGIAIWDTRKQKLLLACDPRADTHLYYYADANEIWFGTWLKTVTSRDTAIDQSAIHEFLRFFYLAPPATIYKNIYRLDAGHYLTCHKSVIKIQAFFNEQPSTTPTADLRSGPLSFLQDFEALFATSIRKRFDNRKVGIFLSGGIDSACIAAAINKVFPGNAKAYTVGFANHDLDETLCAAAFAKHLTLQHNILHFSLDDYYHAFTNMSGSFDQPFGDPACLPVLLTCRHAQDEVEVMTGGSGGDDLFGSHVPRHIAASFIINKIMQPHVRALTANIINCVPYKTISRYANLFEFGDIEDLFIMWDGWSRKELSMLMGYPVDLSESTFYKLFDKYHKQGAQILHDELHFLPPEDSRLEAAGAVGLSYYMPYHDQDVLAFVKRLPRAQRYTKQEAKVLLRSLFKTYFPNNFWDIKKHTFNIPLVNILQYKNYCLINDFLNKNQLIRAGLVPHDNAEQWIKRFFEGDLRLTLKVWSLLVLHAWYFNR